MSIHHQKQEDDFTRRLFLNPIAQLASTAAIIFITIYSPITQ